MARGGLAVVKFINPRRVAEVLRRLQGLQPGSPDIGLPEVDPEGPEVDPEHEFPTQLPVFPAQPDDPEIWPPLELVPPPGPTPEYFYVGVYHESIGTRYVKLHGPTMKEKLQALKDRLPAGGVGGRPPQRPG